MSVSRLVALWLAACALAAPAQAEHISPVCVHATCRQGQRDPQGYDSYLITHQITYVKAEKGESFETSCTPTIRLEDERRPKFPNLESFYEVKLEHCPPPAQGYGAVLSGMNVVVNNTLAIWGIPEEEIITAASLSKLEHIKELILETNIDPLILEPGALDGLHGLKSLNLRGVRPDSVPKQLDSLVLYLTGRKDLPEGALDAASLEVFEPSLKTINGSAPRMRHLNISTAPALVSVVLQDFAPEVLRDDLVRYGSAIKIVELRNTPATALPPFLLRGAFKLTIFTFNNGNITTLPQSLFNDTTKLQLIDLSDNLLETLPKEVFKGLSELRVLLLEHNQLVASSIDAIAPLASLSALSLNDNPIGDLCNADNTSVLSSLHNLLELSLPVTNATRVCNSWLREMPSLQNLDLHGNYIRQVSCADLRVPRASGSNESVIVDLRYNPLQRHNCTVDDHGNDALESKQMRVLADFHLTPKCICKTCSFVQCIRIRHPGKIDFITTQAATTSVVTTAAAITPGVTTADVTTVATATPVVTTPVANTSAATTSVVAPAASTTPAATTPVTTSTVAATTPVTNSSAATTSVVTPATASTPVPTTAAANTQATTTAAATTPSSTTPVVHHKPLVLCSETPCEYKII